MGIGYAAIAMKAGFTPLQTISMSFLVYAGAGQIIAASMVLNGATLMAIILTNFGFFIVLFLSLFISLDLLIS